MGFLLSAVVRCLAARRMRRGADAAVADAACLGGGAVGVGKATADGVCKQINWHDLLLEELAEAEPQEVGLR